MPNPSEMAREITILEKLEIERLVREKLGREIEIEKRVKLEKLEKKLEIEIEKLEIERDKIIKKTRQKN